jgi:hypothetical protein
MNTVVGHSKSLDIMENIAGSGRGGAKNTADETLPLLGDHHVHKHRSRYSMAV